LSRFSDRLSTAQAASHSALTIGLAPELEKMPLPMQAHDDSFLPFGKAIIDATHDLVCAYVFDLAAYLSLGASGAVALERTLAYVPTPIIKILHGPFASVDYLRAFSESAFGVDGITLAIPNDALLTAYLTRSEYGVFVDASNGIHAEPLVALDREYPGQLGVYTLNSSPRTLSLLDPSCAQLRWHGEEITLASRASDFRDAVRNAALAHRVTI